jgi:hypothetical protein
MKNAVLWDITPCCGSCKNRRFGRTYRLHRQDGRNQLAMNNVSSNFQLIVFLRSALQLLVTANFVFISLIISTSVMERVRSSETSVLTRATRRHIPDDGILHDCVNSAARITDLIIIKDKKELFWVVGTVKLLVCLSN